MSPIILTESSVTQLLPKINIQAALREMFAELAQKRAVQPSQTVTLFPEDKGDFITYQGVLAKDKVFGAKLSPYIVNDGPPTITAWTCLMSMETGLPLLLCDSGVLTTERTAATTALAVDLLAKSDSKALAIIGSGAIASAHWNHVEKLRDWKDIRVWSPSLNEDSNKRRKWSDECSNITFAHSADKAIEGADVILLCTSSGKPVIDSNLVNNGALVTSISTNVAQAHEVSPEFLGQAQVYCDYKTTTPDSAGEMVIARRDHDWNVSDLVGDLTDLASEQCAKPNSNSPVFFRSLGLGLEDITIAYEIYVAHNKISEE